MPSFGSALRKARKKRRFTIDDVAAETRLSKRYLNALEAEALTKLPGGTYDRAYLRTYATCLGLDPDPLLEQYERERLAQTEAGRLAAAPDAVATLRQAAARRLSGATGEGRWSGWVVRAGVAAAAVATVVLLGWQGLRWFAPSEAPPGFQAEVETISDPPPVERQQARTDPETLETPQVLAPPATVPKDLPPQASPEQGQASQEVAMPAAEEPAVTPVERDTGPGLSVPQSGVGTDVVDRQLVGRSDTFSAGTRVVFWTLVSGGTSGDTVRHVWMHEGRLASAVDLEVGSPTWRTQSRLTLESAGSWTVEARTVDGQVLARHEFRSEL